MSWAQLDRQQLGYTCNGSRRPNTTAKANHILARGTGGPTQRLGTDFPLDKRRTRPSEGLWRAAWSQHPARHCHSKDEEEERGCKEKILSTVSSAPGLHELCKITMLGPSHFLRRAQHLWFEMRGFVTHSEFPLWPLAPHSLSSCDSAWTRGYWPWLQKEPLKSSKSRAQTMAPPSPFCFR